MHHFREDTLEQLIAKARSTNSMKISNGENSAGNTAIYSKLFLQ